ncbi:MAG: glycosyltransferase [Nanoarchaeota archaeon]|nr:glycosyltransferase [Nanoarchaeota archaeon]
MKYEPKVSVLMSVYNNEEYLGLSIKSVLDQTLKDFEFIIVDDCSKDNSLSIIKKYMKFDKRIVLLENKKNIGLTKSLNKALKKARGRYIARLDSDDIALNNRLKIQYDYLNNNIDVFLIGTGWFVINESGKRLEVRSHIQDYDHIKRTLPIRNCVHHPTFMFRNQTGLYYRNKFRYAQDYDLLLRILTSGEKICNLKYPLIEYREHTNSITMKRTAMQQLFMGKAREFYQQRLRYKKDNYKKFNPKEILSLDLEHSISKDILSYEIYSSFKMNDFIKTRKIIRKYWKYYGQVNKLFVYYTISFFGKRCIDIFRKARRIIKSR